MAWASVYLQSYSLGSFTGKGGMETSREVVDDNHYHEAGWTPTKKNVERESWNIYYTFQFYDSSDGLKCPHKFPFDKRTHTIVEHTED
jgi:hypothetical protein